MGVGRFNFMHILYIFILNKLDKARLREFHKFKCDHESSILI